MAPNRFRSLIQLLLRISVYTLFVLVEIEALLYLSKGYKSGLIEHSPAVYLAPLVLVMPWLIWKRMTALIAANAAIFGANPNVQSGLLILSSSAAIFAYAAVAVAMTLG